MFAKIGPVGGRKKQLSLCAPGSDVLTRLRTMQGARWTSLLLMAAMLCVNVLGVAAEGDDAHASRRFLLQRQAAHRRARGAGERRDGASGRRAAHVGMVERAAVLVAAGTELARLGGMEAVARRVLVVALGAERADGLLVGRRGVLLVGRVVLVVAAKVEHRGCRSGRGGRVLGGRK